MDLNVRGKNGNNRKRKRTGYNWRGYAFEILCLNHADQIKAKLGIAGIESMEYSWIGGTPDDKVQIDMLIDRKDDVINVCEIKDTDKEFEINAEYEKKIRSRMAVFRNATKTEKTLIATMISANGLKQNAYSGIIQNLITATDLFGTL